MATYTLTAAQLRGAGILSSFNIPAGSAPPPTPITVNASITNTHLYNSTLSWATIRNSPTSPTNQLDTFAPGVGAFSGRGSTTFLVSRTNIFFNLSSFTNIISGLTLNIVINSGTFTPSSNIKIFDGGLTTLTGASTEYPIYLNQGSIALSNPVPISGAGTYNITLNSTAISAFNVPSKSRVICVVTENDYNNTEPPLGYLFQPNSNLIANPVSITVS